MKSMKLNNIYDWPLMTRVLVLGLIFFAAFYLGYRFSLEKQFTKLTNATQQEKDLRQELEFVIHKNKTIEAEISHLPAMRAELSKWNKQLIKYQDLPELLNQILKIGADNHLFFSLFTPSESVNVPVPSITAPVEGAAAPDAAAAAPAAPADAAAASAAAATPAPAPADGSAASPAPADKGIFYNKVPIKVVVVGNYHDIADFISQVANLQWIVAVGNFTISTEDQTSLIGEKLAKQAESQHLLTAELMLDIYNLPEGKS